MKNYREDFQNRDMVESVKVPNTDLGQWIGVELECVTDTNYETIADEIACDAAIPALCAKEDGSIHCNYDDDQYDCELNVLTRLDDLDNLKKAIRMLKYRFNAEVNKSCGLHVHLDVRDLDTVGKLKALDNFKIALPFMANLVAPSRLSNTYCALDVHFSSKYYAVTGCHLNSYGTIEVRLHQGSLNFDKIVNWIKLCSAISRAERINALNFDTFAESIGLGAELTAYFKQRAIHMASLNAPKIPDFEPSEVAA